MTLFFVCHDCKSVPTRMYHETSQNGFDETKKFHPRVNFANIICSAFAQIFLRQKNTDLRSKYKKVLARNITTKKPHVKCWWNWLFFSLLMSRGLYFELWVFVFVHMWRYDIMGTGGRVKDLAKTLAAWKSEACFWSGQKLLISNDVTLFVWTE